MSRDATQLRYIGSSTVAFFVRDADEVLDEFTFTLDTAPESDGGEEAILADETDLAGIAREPSSAVLAAGVKATLIGRDALAVIVHQDVGVVGLSLDELRRVFVGDVISWAELGGPELPIVRFTVGSRSATWTVFREQVLDGADFAEAELVAPDRRIVGRVAETPGAIGFISFAFLAQSERRVRALRVEGREPSLFDFRYPIARPLYLLSRPGRPSVERFVRWATSPAGLAIVTRSYPSADAIGSVDVRARDAGNGSLVVNTDTFEVSDGDIEYYPHRSYDLLDPQGVLLQRIRNHRGLNDEEPTPVALAPGVYLVRTVDRRGVRREVYATVRSGQTTVLELDAVKD